MTLRQRGPVSFIFLGCLDNQSLKSCTGSGFWLLVLYITWSPDVLVGPLWNSRSSVQSYVLSQGPPPCTHHSVPGDLLIQVVQSSF